MCDSSINDINLILSIRQLIWIWCGSRYKCPFDGTLWRCVRQCAQQSNTLALDDCHGKVLKWVHKFGITISGRYRRIHHKQLYSPGLNSFWSIIIHGRASRFVTNKQNNKNNKGKQTKCAIVNLVDENKSRYLNNKVDSKSRNSKMISISILRVSG